MDERATARKSRRLASRTNRGVGSFNLFPAAVARDIRQAVPVAGSFVGTADAFRDMAGLAGSIETEGLMDEGMSVRLYRNLLHRFICLRF